MNYKLYLLLALLIVSCSSFGQGASDVSNHIQTKVFENYQVLAKKRRVFLNVQDMSRVQKLNPTTYIAAGLMFLYQNVLSEQISTTCTYEVSCSEYTKLAIQKYGILKGSLIGVHQLSSCTPGAKKEHCKHVISSEGKIKNSLD